MSTTELICTPDRASAWPKVPAVVARDLHLSGPRGPIYGPVDLTIEPGTLTVLTGSHGTGKSALLLTLVGRMKPGRGSRLTVLDEDLPRHRLRVQRRTAAACFNGLDTPDDLLTVSEIVRERIAFDSSWWTRVPRFDDDRVAQVLSPVFGEVPLPRASDQFHEVGELESFLLRIAVAVRPGPALLVVDDIDQLHDTALRDQAWKRLAALAQTGMTVVTTAASDDELDRLGWTDHPHQFSMPVPR